MGAKKHIIVGFLVFLLFASTVLINYGVKYIRATIPLRQFSKLIEQGKINDINLTIYYESPFIFTPFPWSVDNLIKFREGQKIVINGSALEEHIDLFKQIENGVVKPVWKKSSYIDARVYYVFETEEKGKKIFDVAMWGCDGGILVNGVEVKDNSVFYDVIMPFLPEDAAEKWERWTGR